MLPQVHVVEQFNSPDHPNEKDVQSIYAHDHLESCDRCELIASFLDDIGKAVQKMPSSNIGSDI